MRSSTWQRSKSSKGEPMSQMIVVDEYEYNVLKANSSICVELIKEIDTIANELYPNVPYWADCGTNAEVAFFQISEMAREIKKRRRKWKWTL